MKSKKLIIPMILASAFTLAACGASKESSSNEKKGEPASKTASVSQGAKEMKATLADFKTQVSSKDSAKAKQSGTELEETWQKFEDGVKDKSPELYEKVETPLSIIEAGAKAEPLDQKTLSSAADELNKILNDVEKLK
ncbi:hypothetical protein [Peribacillus kribbensis]|uniref:hypothetical protein n=1 Tax=Peribacillus kribbensis TaxID=356658 RepID=UPI000421AA69|nr:hypothetical protein [Peribacillus kribbensis]